MSHDGAGGSSGDQWARDPERARRFYGEVLGLPPGRGAGEFEAGTITLALWAPEAEGVAFFRDPDGDVLIPHRRYR